MPKPKRRKERDPRGVISRACAWATKYRNSELRWYRRLARRDGQRDIALSCSIALDMQKGRWKNLAPERKKNWCPRCKRHHSFFTNPPSWRDKRADCGQWFTQDGYAIKLSQRLTRRTRSVKSRHE